MDIALFAPDSKLINIPLMKLAQYHKSIGDNVGWFNPMFTPDLLYISKLYRYTPEDAYLRARELTKFKNQRSEIK